MRRNTAVAGSFYPNSCDEIIKYINHYSNLLKKTDFNFELKFKPKAIIVPHAGYVYSGFTANVAYSLLQNINPKRVVIIGPSHKVSFKGASIANYDEYISPCKNVPIDKIYSQNLIDEFNFIDFHHQVHIEHSTETQVPFVNHYLPNSSIVEIVYGEISYKEISQIISKALKEGEDTFVIISTDLSHFHNLKDANKLDSVCLEAVDKLDLNIWDQGCDACGRTGVKAMIEVANEFKLHSQILDYRTSYDASNDDKSVVGYMSAILG